jgi:hypothetical protein
MIFARAGSLKSHLDLATRGQLDLSDDEESDSLIKSSASLVQ